MMPMRRYLSEHSLQDIMRMKQNNILSPAAASGTDCTTGSGSISSGGSGSGKIVLPKVSKLDFEAALRHVKPSVSSIGLCKYEQWNNDFQSSA